MEKGSRKQTLWLVVKRLLLLLAVLAFVSIPASSALSQNVQVESEQR